MMVNILNAQDSPAKQRMIKSIMSIVLMLRNTGMEGEKCLGK
jgi:hypothetical protein